MHKQFFLMLIYFTIASFSLSSHAAIYKHVDADGHVTYSNVKAKGAKRLDIAPANTNFGTAAQKKRKKKSKESAANFPKVDQKTQNKRDQSRKAILMSELASEKAALENAKKAYEEGASNPEVSKRKNADGSTSTFRNVAKYQEKLKKLQMDVDVHQRNIELLEKEISNIK